MVRVISPVIPRRCSLLFLVSLSPILPPLTLSLYHSPSIMYIAWLGAKWNFLGHCQYVFSSKMHISTQIFLLWLLHIVQSLSPYTDTILKWILEYVKEILCLKGQPTFYSLRTHFPATNSGTHKFHWNKALLEGLFRRYFKEMIRSQRVDGVDTRKDISGERSPEPKLNKERKR